jgi:hypothetical protein
MEESGIGGDIKHVNSESLKRFMRNREMTDCVIKFPCSHAISSRFNEC